VGAVAVCRPHTGTKQRPKEVLEDAIPESELAPHLEPQCQLGVWPCAVPPPEPDGVGRGFSCPFKFMRVIF